MTPVLKTPAGYELRWDLHVLCLDRVDDTNVYRMVLDGEESRNTTTIWLTESFEKPWSEDEISLFLREVFYGIPVHERGR